MMLAEATLTARDHNGDGSNRQTGARFGVMPSDRRAMATKGCAVTGARSTVHRLGGQNPSRTPHPFGLEYKKSFDKNRLGHFV